MVVWSLFSLFLLTSFANIMTPGLGFIMVMSLSLQRGWKGTLWAIFGLAVGIAILQIAGLSGLGIIIEKSPTLYAAIKFFGALVLFFLAWKSWVKAKKGSVVVHEHKGNNEDTFFWQSVLISLTNPQPLVFTISVFPQFISTEIPFVPQVSIMIAVYAIMVMACGLLYSVLAGHARRFFEGDAGHRHVNQATAVVFFVIGLVVFWLAAKPFL